jgi:hypothetical protein
LLLFFFLHDLFFTLVEFHFDLLLDVLHLLLLFVEDGNLLC